MENCSSKCIVEASSRVRESIVLTLLGGVMTGLSLLIMDSATAEQTPKKLARCEFSPEKEGKSRKYLFSLTKTLPTLEKNWICWRSWGRIRRREWSSRRVSYLEQTLMNLTGISGTIFPIFYQCFPPLWSLIYTYIFISHWSKSWNWF